MLDLFENKKVAESEIKSRKKAYVIYVNRNLKQILYTGESALKLWEVFASNKETKKNVLKGVAAHSTGRKVKGIARIIHRDFSNPEALRKTLGNIQKGDILVSATTDPDFTAGLKKAGAIVTDVGGMLSHAAISARELNIPCIIGTEVASKVLKDGDLVEVDADRGVVRILEKETN